MGWLFLLVFPLMCWNSQAEFLTAGNFRKDGVITITATYGTLTRSVNLTKYRDGLETFCQKAENIYSQVPFPQQERQSFDHNLRIFRQECGSLNESLSDLFHNAFGVRTLRDPYGRLHLTNLSTALVTRHRRGLFLVGMGIASIGGMALGGKAIGMATKNAENIKRLEKEVLRTNQRLVRIYEGLAKMSAKDKELEEKLEAAVEEIGERLDGLTLDAVQQRFEGALRDYKILYTHLSAFALELTKGRLPPDWIPRQHLIETLSRLENKVQGY